MRRSVLIIGMILVLISAMFVLTGCFSDNTNENGNTNEKAEETINEYTYKDLSFKLPSSYKETEGNNSESLIFNTEIKNNVMNIFSVGSFDSQGIENYVDIAADALKDQEFALAGYETTLKKDPQVVEYNGIRVISIDIKYNNTTINGESEVEYCYAQKGDTIYVICFQMFGQAGKAIEDTEFAEEFDSIKNTLQFAE